MTLTTARSLAIAGLALVLGTLGAAPASPAAAPPPASVTAATAPAAATPAAGRTSPVRVRVLTFNIRYGSYGMHRVARQIRRTGAEVVVLNEVDDRTGRGGVHQARWLARRLGMRFVFDANARRGPGLRGNAVLTRYHVRDVRRRALPWPPRTQRRGLLQVRLATRGVSFDVWAMHLNPGRGTLAQARAVASAVGAPTCATVVAGDVNAGPGSREDRVLRGDLRDVWRVAPTTGRGATNWQGDNRIDYLYVAHLRPRRAWTTPPRWASDHRGVVGVLDLDRSRSCT